MKGVDAHRPGRAGRAAQAVTRSFQNGVRGVPSAAGAALRRQLRRQHDGGSAPAPCTGDRDRRGDPRRRADRAAASASGAGDPGLGRRVPHLRPDRRRRRQVLGLERLRPARRQHHDRPPQARRRDRLASGVTQIAAGDWHTCALTAAGGVKCWGSNSEGELGDNTTTDRLKPVDVTGLASGVTQIAAGGLHTCALTAAGGVKCWGYNDNGQLGDNTTTERRTPVDVTGLASGVTQITAGGSHTCALTTAGGVKCWGRNGYGQLGDNTTTTATHRSTSPASRAASPRSPRAATTPAPSPPAAASSAGATTTVGQLGDNTTTDRHTPVDVTGSQAASPRSPPAAITPAP